MTDLVPSLQRILDEHADADFRAEMADAHSRAWAEAVASMDRRLAAIDDRTCNAAPDKSESVPRETVPEHDHGPR